MGALRRVLKEVWRRHQGQKPVRHDQGGPQWQALCRKRDMDRDVQYSTLPGELQVGRVGGVGKMFGHVRWRDTRKDAEGGHQAGEWWYPL